MGCIPGCHALTTLGIVSSAPILVLQVISMSRVYFTCAAPWLLRLLTPPAALHCITHAVAYGHGSVRQIQIDICTHIHCDVGSSAMPLIRLLSHRCDYRSDVRLGVRVRPSGRPCASRKPFDSKVRHDYTLSQQV